MSSDLHRLLGLPDDVDVAQLRKAYEEQMATAARSHDHTRALQLSNALDHAPESVRSAMYRRVTTRVGPIGSEPVATRTRTLTRRPTRVAGRRISQPRNSRSWLRPVLIMVVVAGSVFAVAYLNRDRFSSSAPHFVPPRAYSSVPHRPGPLQNPAVAAALRDAHRVVDGVRSCQQIGGALPAASVGPSDQVHFSCGAGTVRFPLEPGNTVEYLRTGRHDFRVIVTGSDGEFVAYNSRTGSYSG